MPKLTQVFVACAT